MPEVSHLQIGSILGERYQITSQLGSGGMGTVYLADDLKVKGKQRAIKELVHLAEQYQQFIDEADMLVKLNHPYLPNISDYFPPDQKGYSYLVMDYIKGETLLEIFEKNGRKMNYSKILKYSIQLCELFQYIHHDQDESIVYRDLKPSNVMIDEQDNVRLIDFGIARSYKSGQHSDTVQFGTIGFASPEQFENKQTDHRSDLYSLGALIYFLLSDGKYYSYTQKDLSYYNSELPLELVNIVKRLLSYEPNERFNSANALKGELENVLNPKRNKRFSIQRKWLTFGLPILLLLIIIGFIGVNKWSPNSHAIDNADQNVVDLLKLDQPIFAQRKTVLAFELPPNVMKLEWRIQDPQNQMDMKQTEKGNQNGSVFYEFSKPGEFIVEVFNISDKKAGVRLSHSKVNVLPTPKVWFTPVLGKGEKFVSNQKAEFRGMKDEAYKPSKWSWAYRQLKDINGKDVSETLKAIAGDAYTSTRFNDPGIYEIKVQAEDAKGVQSDRYSEQIFIYAMPIIEIKGTPVVNGSRVSINYESSSKNIDLEHDFSAATIEKIHWTLVDTASGKKIKENDETNISGMIQIDVGNEQGNKKITIQAIDSIGAKSIVKNVDIND